MLRALRREPSSPMGNSATENEKTKSFYTYKSMVHLLLKMNYIIYKTHILNLKKNGILIQNYILILTTYNGFKYSP